MDLSNSTFEILTTPKIPCIGTYRVEFIDYIPDRDHLSRLGSGQYTLEEGAVFLADEEDDLVTYDEVLSKYDPTDPIQLDKAHEELEGMGYIKVGNTTVCEFFKRDKKEQEYVLILNIDETG